MARQGFPSFIREIITIIMDEDIKIGEKVKEYARDILKIKPSKIEVDALTLAEKETGCEIDKGKRDLISASIGLVVTGLTIPAAIKIAQLAAEKAHNSLPDKWKSIQISKDSIELINRERMNGFRDNLQLVGLSSKEASFARIVRNFHFGKRLTEDEILLADRIGARADSDAARSYALNLLGSEYGRRGLVNKAREMSDAEFAIGFASETQEFQSRVTRINFEYQAMLLRQFGDIKNTEFSKQIDKCNNHFKYLQMSKEHGYLRSINKENIEIINNFGVPYLHMMLFNALRDIAEAAPLDRRAIRNSVLESHKELYSNRAALSVDIRNKIWTHYLPLAAQADYFNDIEDRNKILSFAMRGYEGANKNFPVIEIIKEREDIFDHMLVLTSIMIHDANLYWAFPEVDQFIHKFTKNANFIDNKAARVKLRSISAGRVHSGANELAIAEYVARHESFDCLLSDANREADEDAAWALLGKHKFK